MKPLKVWWYNHEPNYGDMLTPHILKAFKIPYIQTRKEHAEALMVGSIAKFALPNTKVLGSGFITHDDPVYIDADWRWVRGPLSRQKVLDAGGDCPAIYGDPALLLPLFWDEAAKVHDVGFIPHYIDAPHVKTDMFTIDVLGNPREVTRQITQCRTIISSSLHGLIVAHAYGIPAAYVKLGNRLFGDGFKFQDYYSSIGLDAVESTLDDPVFSLATINLQPMVNALCCLQS
jgi:pyruvyltransferase